MVRPLLMLLDIDGEALENFEALMGLCNIAGISESTRQRIMKEKGLAQIEHYMFEDHEMIRRAAVQVNKPSVITRLHTIFYNKSSVYGEYVRFSRRG